MSRILMPDEGLPSYGTKHCLCIGIDEYEHWPKLGNAVHDAEGVAAAFEELGFDVSLIRNAEATRARLASAIQDDLRGALGPDDLAVVFFAGHGHTHELPGKQKGYVVPVEAGRDRLAELISMDELSDWTDYIPSRHILYVFDSCFSGMATLRADPGRAARDLLRRRARIVVTAGGADQLVVDGGWGNHSVFTGQLLLGLQGEAAGRDGNVTGLTLANYLQSSVPRSARQTPGLGLLPGHGGGDVLLRSMEDESSASFGVLGRAAQGPPDHGRPGLLSRALGYLPDVEVPRLLRRLLLSATIMSAAGGLAWWVAPLLDRPAPPTPTPLSDAYAIDEPDRLYYGEGLEAPPERTVARSQSALNSVWTRLAPDRDSIPAPPVDFTRSMVLAVSAGPMWSGDRLTVDSVTVESSPRDVTDVMRIWVGLFEACLFDDPERIWPVSMVQVPRFDGRLEWQETREASAYCPGGGD